MKFIRKVLLGFVVSILLLLLYILLYRKSFVKSEKDKSNILMENTSQIYFSSKQIFHNVNASVRDFNGNKKFYQNKNGSSKTNGYSKNNLRTFNEKKYSIVLSPGDKNFFVSELNSHFIPPKSRMVITVVCCGDRVNETIVMLKSAAALSYSPLLLIVFTDENFFLLFIDMYSKWPLSVTQRVSLEIKKISYPAHADEKLWREFFKPCSSARLFFPGKLTKESIAHKIMLTAEDTWPTQAGNERSVLKFDIVTTLDNVDSILYVDSDTVFMAPPEIVWNNFLYMNSSQMAALAPEHEDLATGWYNRFAKHPYYGRLGINSGVMLMNLTKFRQFGWEDYIVPIYKSFKSNLVWGDQDIINIIFHYHPDKLYEYGCEYNYRPDHCMYMSFCKKAETHGIYVLHGNRQSFHSSKYPAFRAIYNAWFEMTFGVNWLALLATLTCLSGSNGNLSPVFTSPLSPKEVSEDTPVGSTLYTLKARDPEGGSVTFKISGSPKVRVHSTTGDIVLIQALDRENEDMIRLVVSAEDVVPGAPENNVVRAQLTFSVLDANDNSPIFSKNSYRAVVTEDIPPGSVIIPDINLLDIDQTGDVISVICHPVTEDACSVFEVMAKSQDQGHYSGILVLKELLSFARTPRYEFRLVASDGNHMVNVPAEITVSDIQDSPPVFEGSLSSILPEDAPVGSVVMTIKATDGDEGSPRNVFYELISNPFDYFVIEAESGRLKTKKLLDRESLSATNGVVEAQVKAYEVTPEGKYIGTPDAETTELIRVTIRDVNDEPPTFNRKEFVSSIPENIPDGTPLSNLDMFVQDTDAGSNSVFSLRIIDPSGFFGVEPEIATGSTSVSLRLVRGPLDYENPNLRKFTLLIAAEETMTNPRLSSTATVILSIKDVNDNSPTFDRDFYSITISETASSGTIVASILAKDRDSGQFGTDGIKYSLFGNGAEKFEIDEMSGVITVAPCETPGHRNCLNFEEKPDYFLSLEASDDGGNGHSTVVPIRIVLTDSNDNSPRFTNPFYRAVIGESASDFDSPFFVQAVDKDASSNVRYSLIGGEQTSLFKINSDSGRITVADKTGLDISSFKTNIFDFSVEASDGIGSHTAKVQVFVKDINNNSPIFSRNFYEAAVQETAPEGSVVDQVTASDADTGVNAEISYRIHKGGYNYFHVNSTSGVVTVTRKLDFDLRDRFVVEILAVDGGIPQLTATATLAITVINNNDKFPYFTPATQRTQIREDEEPGSVFYTLKAEDPDVDETIGLQYGVEGVSAGVDGDGKPLTREELNSLKTLFSVDSQYGAVSTQGRLDRNIATEVTLSVSVIDRSASPIQVGRGTLVITVVDVNDFPPVFPPPWSPESPTLTVSIQEELPLDSTVTTILASDVDSNIAKYELAEPSEFFALDGTTGVVTIKKRLDFESQRQHSLVIIAKDTGIPQLSASTTVIVNLINVNDEEPKFLHTVYNASVQENSPPGTSIIRVTARDDDIGEFGKISYTLAGLHHQHFTIDSTGQISVINGAILDRENLNLIVVRVVATDTAPEDLRKQNSVPVHIKVTDINDHPPVFSQKVYSASVVENISLDPPAPIVQVTAHDADAGINAAILYSVAEGNEEGEFSDSAVVEITVLPQNQFKPLFIIPAHPNTTVKIPENGDADEADIIIVKARDDDEGQNGQILYHLRVGDDNVQETEEFHLDPISGVLMRKRVLDREERHKYELVLVAKDQGSPISYESLRFLTVLIEDVNDNQPFFTKNNQIQDYKFSLMENLPKNTLIGQVQATDFDAGENARIFYIILEGNEDKGFYIDKAHGNIYANTVLDREAKSVYNLVIKATNNPNLSFSTSTKTSLSRDDPSLAFVVITVDDMNDTPPTFSKDEYYAGVPHDAEVERFIRSVAADDGDLAENGTLLYTITASNLYKPGDLKPVGSLIPSPFNISDDGRLYTSSLMAQYRRRRFVLEINAREVAPPHRSANCNVHVWVWEPEDLIAIVLAVPPEEAGTRQQEIADILSDVSEGNAVVDEIRYHVQEDQTVKREWTDMLVHIVNKSEQVMPVPVALRHLDNGYEVLKSHQKLIEIERIQPAYTATVDEDFDIRIGGLIALLIILFMGFILFIVACCSLKMWKLKTYEEQELTMQVMSEFDPATVDLDNTGVSEGNHDWNADDVSIADGTHVETQSNAYATIQKSHTGTIRSLQLKNLQEQLRDEFVDDDYATLDNLRKNKNLVSGPKVAGVETPLTVYAHDEESEEFQELRTSFTGSTFQPPESMVNRPLPQEPYGEERGNEFMSHKRLGLNDKGEPVLISELI